MGSRRIQEPRTEPDIFGSEVQNEAEPIMLVVSPFISVYLYICHPCFLYLCSFFLLLVTFVFFWLLILFVCLFFFSLYICFSFLFYSFCLFLSFIFLLYICVFSFSLYLMFFQCIFIFFRSYFFCLFLSSSFFIFVPSGIFFIRYFLLLNFCLLHLFNGFLQTICLYCSPHNLEIFSVLMCYPSCPASLQ